MYEVKFPGLGLNFNIDPVAFSVFGKEIYWYGIIISFGFLIAILFAVYESKRTGLNPEVMMDVVLVGTPTAIIGARIYYVIFNWGSYAENFWEIFAIWHGGIAIYGAIIAAIISTFIYCRVKRIKIYEVLDIGAFGLLIGQTVGRWGNFVNKEAYGRETTLPWRMELFDIEQQRILAVHPTFLYESLWNVIGLIGLLIYRRRKKVDGEIFFLYVFWYGLGRFWIEGLRTDSLYFVGLRVSQGVAALSVVIGIIAFIYLRKKVR